MQISLTKIAFLLGLGLMTSINATANHSSGIISGEVVVPSQSANNPQGDRRQTLHHLPEYAQRVNEAVWSADMKINSAMTVKLQVLLDWNHASPGPIDGGWGVNSKQALSNFQKIHGLQVTGKLNQDTWQALTKNIDADQPVLVAYTLTEADTKAGYKVLPKDVQSLAKLPALNYESIQEMLAERFHMDIAYLKKLNADKKFTKGETITVINPGKPLEGKITQVIASQKDKTLYAYQDGRLVATYPTTIGDGNKSPSVGNFKVVNKVQMPTYKAVVALDDQQTQTLHLPSGPNSPVGVIWVGLSQTGCGIHGSPTPEKIGRPQSLGCIRLTNWDALELGANLEVGTKVEIR